MSGPKVARAFHRLLALVFVVAWASLGAQVQVLIGSRGLLPIADFLERVQPAFWQFPTPFHWTASDRALSAGIWAGGALAASALLGVYPRLCIGLSTVLYLGYAVACRTFLSFQWDNLLLECGTLALFLPRDRPAPWIHFLFRFLLFKLYFESGIAKWQSHLGDWQDGSAMTYYYETAPLPAFLAWYAHHLPAAWHHFESWATLVLELVFPFGIFAPRRLRLATAVAFTGFQVLNALTANYGFFCYLSAALHVFLLSDRDLPGHPPVPPSRSRGQGRRAALSTAALVLVYTAISLADALAQFGPPGAWDRLAEVRSRSAAGRLINTYHLFGHITRERIEPEAQSFDGRQWTAHDLRYKPGDPGRAPGFVAPHQPRVDFQLWFYGLGFRQGTPQYVRRLVDRLCHDPQAVQALFAAALPDRPQAVRIAYWRYRFSSPAERRASGQWWKRELLGTSRAVSCGKDAAGARRPQTAA